MDVLLDSNIYLQDLRMTGNRFQELFTYLRRTGSSLVLPHLVREEVIGKYSIRLKDALLKTQQALEHLSKLTIQARAEFRAPNVEQEAEALRKRLRSPSQSVRVVEIDGYENVDIKEVVNRSILRKRPASADGEELRDVILWLIALHLARNSRDRIAFVSNDKTFAADNELHPELGADLTALNLELDFYPGIREFVIAKALQHQPLDADQFWQLLPKERLDEAVLAQILSSTARVGRIVAADIRELELEHATQYKVQDSAFFIEITLHGSAAISVETLTYTQVQLTQGSGQVTWNQPPESLFFGNISQEDPFPWIPVESTTVIGQMFGKKTPSISDFWNSPTQTVSFTPAAPHHYLCSFKASLSARVTDASTQTVEAEAIQFTSFLSDERNPPTEKT